MKRKSIVRRALENYFTDDDEPRSSHAEIVQIPEWLLDRIPEKQERTRSIVRRWFTDCVEGYETELDLAELQRLVGRLNLQKELWQALRTQAEARRAALRLAETTEKSEERERLEREYQAAAHETRMLQERLEQARLRKEHEALSAPARPAADEAPKEETIRDQISRLLANVSDFVGAQVEIERVAKANADAAKERGADEEQCQRVRRRTYNLGMQMLEELLREKGKKPPAKDS